jgi:hypothetical protein
MQGKEWQMAQAETCVRKLFEAAKTDGPQLVVEADGHYEITFRPKKQSLGELFSQPGPIETDDR